MGKLGGVVECGVGKLGGVVGCWVVWWCVVG